MHFLVGAAETMKVQESMRKRDDAAALPTQLAVVPVALKVELLA